MAESFPNRTQVPNIVDDMGLDPYERALYVHYKRVCGEDQSAYCFEATKTTAQKVKMSMGQVSESRKQLALKGLVIVQKGQPVVVTVVNIWELNTSFYQLENRPDIDGWTVEQVKLWLSSVHTVNLTTHNHSNMVTRSETNLTYCDDSVHTVNDDSHSENLNSSNDNMSSGVHTVKQRSKESLLEESKPIKESLKGVAPPKKLSPGPVTLALLEICKLDWGYVQDDSALRTAFKRTARLLQEAQPGDVREFENWRKSHHWTGKKDDSAPTLKQVGELWGQFQEWITKGRPAPTGQNGATKNGHYGKPTKQKITTSQDQDQLRRMYAATLTTDDP